MKKWLNNMNWAQLVPMIRKHQKKLVVVLALVVVLLGIVGWRNSQWVMKINGQKISKEEYGFYQKVYPNLSEEKLETRIVEDKVQLQQGKKIDDEIIVDYPVLLAEMKKKNSENQKKIKNKQVIYGLRKYTEQTFYTHNLSLAVGKLREKKKLQISKREVEEYYKENQANFLAMDSKEFYRVEASKKRLNDLMKKKLTIKDVEALTDVQVEKVTLSEETLRDWMKYRDEELQSIQALKKEKWSPVFDEQDQSWSYFCVSSQKTGIKTLKEVQESIKQRLELEKYQKDLKGWIEKAKVERK